jgi:hypothetical protein
MFKYVLLFKYVLSVSLAMSFASAATISTSATCDGVTTIGTTFAMCNIPFGAGAVASITAPSFEESPSSLETPFRLSVSAAGPGNQSTSASANFSDDYVFTVLGGTGGGLFFPCFVGSGQGSGGGSFAGVVLGFTDVPGNGTTNCGIQLRGGTPQPFTFGVPQVVPVGLQAFAGVGPSGEFDANVSLYQILFFDPSGNPLSNVTFTLVEVPEPSAWSLVSIGLIFLAVAIRGVRLGMYH